MPEQHKFVFISGLHRSGTTLLHNILRQQPSVSGFKDTGVPMDEGQHLQTVFPPAIDFGGPGHFGFHREAHMTETHPLATPEQGARLLAQWSPFWELDKPIVLEKSPPNIIRMRYLQAIFPGAHFIVLLRHPIPTSLATQKWSRSSLAVLIRHWIKVHTLLDQDLPFLKNICMLSYEALMHDPSRELDRLGTFLGIPIRTTISLTDQNPKYHAIWNAPDLASTLRRIRISVMYGKIIRHFGYSLNDFGAFPVYS